ncbi:MAG: NUDIX domain-containing protein [Nanoarchaeota archaeon]
MVEKYQKIVVTGLLKREGKVLILKRSSKEDFLPNYWELPSGKVEFGETVEQALKREFKEETNLDIEVKSPYKIFSYLSDNKNRHTIEIIFHVSCKDIKKLIISEDHQEYIWISKDDIKKYKISKEISQSILEGINNK